jgi:hemerythrin-like domain-containing protein
VFPDLFNSAPTFDDPLGMLRACHRRIERALTILDRVIDREERGALDQGARDALRQMLYYFSHGVPRHSADEETSLFPRLRAALDSEHAGAAAVLERMEAEHATLDAAHRELEGLAEDLLQSGRFSAPERRARFRELTAQLESLYREHIRAEDDELFPLAAEVVEPFHLEAVGAEMAARRGIDWGHQAEVVRRFRARAF